MRGPVLEWVWNTVLLDWGGQIPSAIVMESVDQKARVIHFGPFVADPDLRSLCRGARRIPVQEQPFQVLLQLLERPGELVTRHELHQRLWAANSFVDFDHGLNIAINKLREALGDSVENPRFIQTVPRRGYRFIAPVGQRTAGPAANTPVAVRLETPQRTEPSTAVAASERPDQSRQRRTQWRIALAGTSLAALAAFFAASVRDTLPDSAYGASISRLAVLPLQNLSGDREQEYFAVGMTDELITSLAKLQTLKVVSRSSTIRYEGTARSLPDIARELNVDGIIEGTVLYSGNRVRITVQLIRAATDQHLWAETYDGNVQDVITLQDSIARAVAIQVRANLAPAQQAYSRGSKLVVPAAYEDYLRGRYFFNDRWSKQSDAAAAHYFEQAIAKDPTYAPAYAGLANYYTFKGFDQRTDRTDAMKAKDLAARALELDDGLAEAHIAMANALYRLDWNWAEAGKEFSRGIALNPDDPESVACFAVYLAVSGQFAAAISNMQHAIQLDPLSATLNTRLGLVLHWSGQNEQAVDQLRKSIALDPLLAAAHFTLALAYERLGSYDSAVAEYLESDRISGVGPSLIAGFQRSYSNSGIDGFRRAKLESERQRAAAGEANYFVMAKLAADLGETDTAFRWLEMTYQQRDLRLANIKVAASLRSLHHDPRFADLVRRIGIP